MDKSIIAAAASRYVMGAWGDEGVEASCCKRQCQEAAAVGGKRRKRDIEGIFWSCGGIGLI